MKEIEAYVRPRFVDSVSAELGSLKIAGVYCDFSAYLAATRHLQSIADHCTLLCEFHSNWWSFETLRAACEREQADRAAAEADMIWCAACVCKPLPNPVKTWLKEWLARKHKAVAALVVLLRCPPRHDFERTPNRLCMWRDAQAAGVDFFAGRFNCACERVAKEHSRAALRNGYEKSSTVSQPIRPVVDRGINE
jgi:hypothetical protein